MGRKEMVKWFCGIQPMPLQMGYHGSGWNPWHNPNISQPFMARRGWFWIRFTTRFTIFTATPKTMEKWNSNPKTTWKLFDRLGGHYCQIIPNRDLGKTHWDKKSLKRPDSNRESVFILGLP
jgi:hypothetical protein